LRPAAAFSAHYSAHWTLPTMKRFCSPETHRFALDAGFQTGDPGSPCLKPQSAPAAASFCPTALTKSLDK